MMMCFSPEVAKIREEMTKTVEDCPRYAVPGEIGLCSLY